MLWKRRTSWEIALCLRWFFLEDPARQRGRKEGEDPWRCIICSHTCQSSKSQLFNTAVELLTALKSHVKNFGVPMRKAPTFQFFNPSFITLCCGPTEESFGCNQGFFWAPLALLGLMDVPRRVARSRSISSWRLLWSSWGKLFLSIQSAVTGPGHIKKQPKRGSGWGVFSGWSCQTSDSKSQSESLWTQICHLCSKRKSQPVFRSTTLRANKDQKKKWARQKMMCTRR